MCITVSTNKDELKYAMNSDENRNNFDVIIIGSGIGGLTAGAFLSKTEQKKVLVLEKHSISGGLTHTFSRNGFRWDVGVHYVGCMHKGSLQRDIIDYVTDYKLNWKQMVSPFEEFIHPNKTVPVSDSLKEFKEELYKAFPSLKKEINRYFAFINRGALWFRLHFLSKNLPWPLSLILNGIKSLIPINTKKSTMEYLTEITGNDELNVMLTSQWADYGVSPLEGSFIMHATTIKHYMGGGFVPEGGSEKIFKAIEPVVTKNNGAVLTRHEVRKITTDDGTVTGVTALHKGEEIQFNAPVVIANCGAHILYQNLLHSKSSLEKNKLIAKMDPSSSAIIVYLGLNDSHEKIGLHGQNIWINNTGRLHTIDEYSKALIVDKKPLGCFLSFHTVETEKGDNHTATIIATVNYKYFEKWKDQPCMKRDEEYQKLKQEIADALLDLVEEKLPGLKELVAYCEVSTPLTLEHFSAKRMGSMYSFKTDPSFFPQNVFPVKSEVRGLYQAGTDVCAPGFVAAMMGGTAAAGAIISPLGMLGLIVKARLAGKRRRRQS